MLSLFKIFIAVCALALLAAARPAPSLESSASGDLIDRAPSSFVAAGKQSTLSVCPTWTVRCVKDGDWPKGIVGDIGPQPFCFRFPRCYQCEEQANSDEVRARRQAGVVLVTPTLC